MIARELTLFLIVGSTTVLVDFAVYHALLATAFFGHDAAKTISFLAGTAFAYFANRLWTFGHKTHAAGSLWRFLLVYGLTLGANVAVNSVLLKCLEGDRRGVQMAFLGATAVSAALNFLGMKIFVFKAKVSASL